METKTPDMRLYVLSSTATRLSSRVLEQIANEVANRPEFPARLSGAAADAFSNVCFELMLRHGQGTYDGFRSDASMRRNGAFYLDLFNHDPRMNTELGALMTADELTVEAFEHISETAYVELPEASEAIPAQSIVVSQRSAPVEPLALIEARQRVAEAYNDLP